MYENIILFLSFVYAIAITHVLSTANELIQARRRLKVSGLLVGWMVTALLLLIINWLSAADLASIRHWTIGGVLLQFLTTLTQYFTCAFIAMRVPAEGDVDMPAHFEAQRVPILTAFLALGALAALNNFTQSTSPRGWVGQDLEILVSCAPMAAAVLSRARPVQWLAVATMLAAAVFFLGVVISVN